MVSHNPGINVCQYRLRPLRLNNYLLRFFSSLFYQSGDANVLLSTATAQAVGGRPAATICARLSSSVGAEAPSVAEHTAT